ncbi:MULTISPECIES: hypothetical protein [Treponema]|uniref:hypothetical protein n=1 Tax=Treponema TaxID=157 RepID=UPI0001FD3731|nr:MULTISPECIES: hypothetical protein [Treponema]EGC77247.1 hypothetical protein HMPREF9353_01597 [Treponema denticola F0402]EMB43280.1 hypothetical protein HMPREF9729_02268 [Treponema denticola ASLM]EMD56643.1 hypothetical protein HMPREF9728_01457 [Treponema denticola US-Trep]UTD10054.1 hypothetical protein HYB91_05830 [Treponema sp. B152]
MKKILGILVFFTCVSILFSLDVTASITVGNTPFNSNGYTGKIPDFGFKLILNEDLGKNVNGKLAIERHLGIGNIIWGRIAYTTDMINIAIGPTLSVFNAGFDNKNVSTIFQPGLGTSLSFKLPIGFFTSLDTNFSIPLASVKTKNVYLQNGHFDLGWRFPNIIASIKLSQKNKSIVDNPDETHISISDIGFYTVSYSKPSGIRIPLNIIYRVNHFQKTGSLNEKIADIVLETGISHSASSDIEWFVNLGASVFSFSLTNAGSRVKKFFFNAEAGIVLNFN